MKQFIMKHRMLAIGSLMAAVAVYFWGVIWFPLMAQYKTGGWIYDDDEALRLVQTQILESGTYVIPGPGDDPETLTDRRERGPVLTVQYLKKEDVLSLWQVRGWGTLQILVTTFLIGLTMRTLSPSLNYRSRVMFVALAGLTAAVYNDLSDAIWWYHPCSWSLITAIYDCTAWIIAGFVLAWFIKPEYKDTTEQNSTEA
jgi:hypothetical protein